VHLRVGVWEAETPGRKDLGREARPTGGARLGVSKDPVEIARIRRAIIIEVPEVHM